VKPFHQRQADWRFEVVKTQQTQAYAEGKIDRIQPQGRPLKMQENGEDRHVNEVEGVAGIAQRYQPFSA
jgi:hypothetical protein